MRKKKATPQEPLDILQERLGIHFQKRELLIQAITHRSFVVDEPGALSNERLEFLGDAVMGMIISEELFQRHPDWPEGVLTKARSGVVDRKAMEQIGRGWELGVYMRVSRQEEAGGVRERRSLLADGVEAIIGAYFLDAGLDVCRTFVLRELAPMLEAIERGGYEDDYKTMLQERIQELFHEVPTYEVICEQGPAHARDFTVAAMHDGVEMGRGNGRSKKEAEQQAAAQALGSPMLKREQTC